jgi:hypothetical protein
MGTFRMPTPIKRKHDKSQYFWMRKKVPLRLRGLIGQAEVWRSLGTADRRAAIVKCTTLSADLETEWSARWNASQAGLPDPITHVAPVTALSKRDAVALAGVAYRQLMKALSDNPGSPLRWTTAIANHDGADPERDEQDDIAMDAFLAAEGVSLDAAGLARFRPEFVKAQRDAYVDLKRNAQGDYGPSPAAMRFPEMQAVKLDFIAAFERYALQGGLKGGEYGPTAKRWRPKTRRSATGPATVTSPASRRRKRSSGLIICSSKKISPRSRSAT